MFCEVYLLDVPYHLDRAFDYSAGEEIRPGLIVRVPFGRANRLRLGVVTAVKDEIRHEEGSEPINIKPVHSVTHQLFALTPEMLGLCLFIKEHTLSTFGEALRAILPPGALSDTLNISVRKTCSLAVTREAALTMLLATGRLGIRSEGQRTVLRYLAEVGSADAEVVRMQPGVTLAHINALRDKGLITVDEHERIRNPYEKYAEGATREPIHLTRAQTNAYEVDRKSVV